MSQKFSDVSETVCSRPSESLAIEFHVVNLSETKTLGVYELINFLLYRMEEKYVWENPIREEKITRYKPVSMAVQQASDPIPDYLNLLFWL